MIDRKSSRRDVHVPEMAEYKKPVTPTDVNVAAEFSTSSSIALSGILFAKIRLQANRYDN